MPRYLVTLTTGKMMHVNAHSEVEAARQARQYIRENNLHGSIAHTSAMSKETGKIVTRNNPPK